ncbi:MAG: OmpA family protein [Candidatus Tectimicrobiota bacterium]
MRHLLLGPERHQLERLQEHLDNLRLHPEEVSQVLAEAVLLCSHQDKQLTNALLPTIEEALQASVRKNPRILIDILFPMLGPAIRKAISTALRSMIEVLNHSLEMSLSLRGLQWRLEALRTGKPFAEVLFLHTLAYRVEQVFLIHKDTGLLLQHVVAESVPVQDAEMVSGMLTAIQDFMRDSFGGSEDETLNTVQYGDRRLLIEQGPLAILAGVVRGSVPPSLHTTFQEAIESIHFEARDSLLTFAGDATPFAAIHHHLEACLQQQRKTAGRRRSFLPLGLVSACLLLGLLGWSVTLWRAHTHWLACQEAVRRQPGVVLLTAEWSRGAYRLSGLLDPLAPDPLEVPALAQQCPAQVTRHWQSYYALHPAFVEQRASTILAPPASTGLTLDTEGVLHATGTAPYEWIMEAQKLSRLIPGVRRLQTDLLQIVDHPTQILARARTLLAPPATVTLLFDNGVLTATGEAPHAWILAARQQARSLSGVKQWREEHLVDATAKTLQALKERLETYTVHFQKGNALPVAGQDDLLADIALTIQRLAETVQQVGGQMQIEVFGHTDRSGSVEENLKLGQERANYVINALTTQGLGEVKMIAVRAGWRQPAYGEMTEQDRALNRRVSLRAILTDVADEKG